MPKPTRTTQAALFFAITSSFITSGCGLLFGGSQKVDNKAHGYKILRLDKEAGGEWRRLSDKESTVESDGVAQDRSDIAFENIKTKAIISLNSVCGVASDRPLEELSKSLLMGVGVDSDIITKPTIIDGEPASESTLTAESESGGQAKVRAVVTRKAGCAYDFMFIAKPSTFDKQLPWFDRFLKEFHVE